ncbi:hypothetical protein Tco_1512713, partial [Tanacetum coccineum]
MLQMTFGQNKFKPRSSSNDVWTKQFKPRSSSNDIWTKQCQMTFGQNSSSLVLHQKMFGQNSSGLGVKSISLTEAKDAVAREVHATHARIVSGPDLEPMQEDQTGSNSGREIFLCLTILINKLHIFPCLFGVKSEVADKVKDHKRKHDSDDDEDDDDDEGPSAGSN